MASELSDNEISSTLLYMSGENDYQGFCDPDTGLPPVFLLKEMLKVLQNNPKELDRMSGLYLMHPQLFDAQMKTNLIGLIENSSTPEPNNIAVVCQVFEENGSEKLRDIFDNMFSTKKVNITDTDSLSSPFLMLKRIGSKFSPQLIFEKLMELPIDSMAMAKALYFKHELRDEAATVNMLLPFKDFEADPRHQQLVSMFVKSFMAFDVSQRSNIIHKFLDAGIQVDLVGVTKEMLANNDAQAALPIFRAVEYLTTPVTDYSQDADFVRNHNRKADTPDPVAMRTPTTPNIEAAVEILKAASNFYFLKKNRVISKSDIGAAASFYNALKNLDAVDETTQKNMRAWVTRMIGTVNKIDSSTLTEYVTSFVSNEQNRWGDRSLDALRAFDIGLRPLFHDGLEKITDNMKFVKIELIREVFEAMIISHAPNNCFNKLEKILDKHLVDNLDDCIDNNQDPRSKTKNIRNIHNKYRKGAQGGYSIWRMMELISDVQKRPIEETQQRIVEKMKTTMDKAIFGEIDILKFSRSSFSYLDVLLKNIDETQAKKLCIAVMSKSHNIKNDAVFPCFEDMKVKFLKEVGKHTGLDIFDQYRQYYLSGGGGHPAIALMSSFGFEHTKILFDSMAIDPSKQDAVIVMCGMLDSAKALDNTPNALENTVLSKKDISVFDFDH